MKIALQLYSIKDEMEKDFMGTLEKVAKMGYQGVEFAGYGGYTAGQIKAKLDELGISAAGSHISLDALRADAAGVADFAQEIGAYSVVCPYIQMNSKEGWIEAAKELNEYGKIMHEKGIVFGYHNHAHEFETFDGVCALDLLFEHSDPRYVTCQFDTYWVLKGGKVPQEYIAKYKGRCPTIHVKDMGKDGTTDTEVGTGCIDFQKVFEAAGNVQWFILEQEDFTRSPLESVQIGCDMMKQYAEK